MFVAGDPRGRIVGVVLEVRDSEQERPVRLRIFNFQHNTYYSATWVACDKHVESL